MQATLLMLNICFTNSTAFYLNLFVMSTKIFNKIFHQNIVQTQWKTYHMAFYGQLGINKYISEADVLTKKCIKIMKSGPKHTTHRSHQGPHHYLFIVKTPFTSTCKKLPHSQTTKRPLQTTATQLTIRNKFYLLDPPSLLTTHRLFHTNTYITLFLTYIHK